jgi:alpha-amylase
MNYMNVLSDFEIRLNRFIPDRDTQNEIFKLNNLIKEKESIIDQQTSQIDDLKKKSQGKKKSPRLSASKTKTVRKVKSKIPVKTKKVK